MPKRRKRSCRASPTGDDERRRCHRTRRRGPRDRRHRRAARTCLRDLHQEIDRWWRRGRRFRSAPGDAGIVFLEPGPGGRVFESFGPDRGAQVREMGRTLVWDPPHRLVLEWRAANFAPSEKTEVEVLFRPSALGTTVVLVHRGWRAIRAGHPVRHGLDVDAFCRLMGSWWGDQLTMLRLQSR